MRNQTKILEERSDVERDRYIFSCSPEDLYKYIKENKPVVYLFDLNSSRLFNVLGNSHLILDNNDLLNTLGGQFNTGKDIECRISLNSNTVSIYF